ncbi:PLP-dependent aspartate aminotransferase family protein [Amaricoccus sp.]|uniref:trans-sulfuration enzyme family protein n=1 Tax=Amaricoccus sp. TaxID=1872485 RepID=UPI001B6B59C7|nr:PLP-dependent aspartate aminotransferase family protein [Amaricoccus sp.]MBP7002525.1 PLP-dependent transferase [Amaricoccus sp.]
MAGRRNAPPSPATIAAQALRRIDPRTGAVVPGIELASTFARDEGYAARQAYIYARDGGPTVEHVEAVLAAIEGAEGTLVFASGMAAMAALVETLATGDHVVAPGGMYLGGANWLRRMQARRGIEVSFVEAETDGGAAATAAAIRPGRTRLVWLETPSNPAWDIADIAAAAEAAHAGGAILAVDCTAAPPCTTRALALGADVAFHSGTKYLGGHSDLTAGVLSLARRDALWEELCTVRRLMGSVMAAFEAWLLLRGLRTLHLRYARASENALAIARHFDGHPRVARVLYPGLPGHPGHAVAARQMTGGFGGMLSLLVAGTEAQAVDVARFAEAFIPATSLGGVESLIEHRRTVEGEGSPAPPTLLRLSVGIEDPADLIADLEQALERAGCGG